MAANNVVDLDVLRPPERIVKLGGNEIDVSFVACGITFEVDDIVRRLGVFDKATLEKGGEEAREAFKLSVELCSLFCRRKYPEMTPEWFLEHTEPRQLTVFTQEIQGALVRSLAGVEQYPKTPTRAKAKTK